MVIDLFDRLWTILCVFSMFHIGFVLIPVCQNTSGQLGGYNYVPASACMCQIVKTVQCSAGRNMVVRSTCDWLLPSVQITVKSANDLLLA